MSFEAIIEQRWREATIQDNFIFSRTMELYPNLCRRLLELILNVKIKELHFPEREKTIEARVDSKGIRLDVYVEDKNSNRSFDVEMQISDSDNIAKRMRYYQGLIDLDKLKRGEHYGKLGESYIIFICPFDKFKQGRHIYTFREHCEQDTGLKLNDGTAKIFLSTKGTLNDVSPEVKAFLDYVDRGIVAGRFVSELNRAVDSVKFNEKARLGFMTFQMFLLEEKMVAEARGRAEGLAEGRSEGLAEGRVKGLAEGREAVAIKLLHKGKSLDEIHELTEIPLERIQQLAKEFENISNH